ncbi:hypothetical protein KR038_005192 [Drosophila bunnanda]|nr:hypothetical protein KR038_005192 [Drosophila bunnanda]
MLLLAEYSDLDCAEGAIRHSLLTFTTGQRGCKLLAFNGHNYVRNRRSGLKTYWICSKKGSTKCNARVVTNVVEGVHKIVLESCYHTCHNTGRKKRLSGGPSMVIKSRSTSSRPRSYKSMAAGIRHQISNIKSEEEDDYSLELGAISISIEDMQRLN